MHEKIHAKTRKTRRKGRLCSILLCIAMLITQAAPVAFADDGTDAAQTENETESVQITGETDTAEEDGASDGETGEAPDDADTASDEAADESAAAEDEESSDQGADGQEDNASLLENETEIVPATEESDLDISWYSADSATKSVTLVDAADLRGLAALVNGTATDSSGTAIAAVDFSGWTITLGADTDLGGTPADTTATAAAWTPIGLSSDTAFKGTFDGNNKKISGILIDGMPTVGSSAGYYTGLFGYVSDATIKNLSIEGKADIKTNSEIIADSMTEFAGGLVGYADGGSVISGVTANVTVSCATTPNDIVGILAGRVSDSEISGCSVSGSLSMTQKSSGRSIYGGGLAGSVRGSVISSCTSSAAVSCDLGGTVYIGGAVGDVNASTDNAAVLDSVTNTGSVTIGENTKPTGAYAAGVVGYVNGKSTILRNLVNSGSVTVKVSSQVNAGGLAGLLADAALINSVNNGAVTVQEGGSTQYTGGVAGYMEGDSRVENCLNTAVIKANKTTYLALLAGNIKSGTGGTVKNSYSVSAESADGTASSLFMPSTSTKISGVGYVSATGTVTAADGYTLLSSEVSDLSKLLDMGTINLCSDYEDCRLWKAGTAPADYSPAGDVVIKATTPSVKLTASADSVMLGETITLTADISAAANSTALSQKLSYQWYVSDKSTGALATALTGDGTSGTLEGLTGTITYKLSASEYSDRYYFVTVTNTATYGSGSSTLGTTAAECDSDVLELIFKSNDGKYYGETAESFAGGDGTSENPYLIENASQLKLMATTINSGEEGAAAHYKLKNDIDFNNMKWTPAGTPKNGEIAENPFTGSFDGAGYTVSGLNILPETARAGFFGYTKGAVIKDVTIKGKLNVDGEDYAGGIVGYAVGGEFSGLTSYVDISADDFMYIGGIVGCVNGTSSSAFVVDGCRSGGSITVERTTVDASGDIGGISGYAFCTSLRNCINTGSISFVDNDLESTYLKYQYLGGITGCSNLSFIRNCANTGDITATGSENPNQSRSKMFYMAGITPNATATSLAASGIENCINTGALKVSGGGDKASRMTSGFYVASSSEKMTIKDCYVLQTSDENDTKFYLPSKNSAETSGLGIFDTAGALTAFDGYTLNYTRTDQIKTLMAAGNYTDLYCALNNWAGDKNDSDAVYSSWTGSGSALLPVGAKTVSPVANMDADIDKREIDGVYEYNSEIPELKLELSGVTDTSASLVYQWYKGNTETMEDRESLGDSATSASYTPSGTAAGSLWYTADATAVSGCYFKTDTANPVNIQIRSEDGIWGGIVASQDDLKGYGTEESPYLVENGEVLALMAELINTNASTPEDDPDTEDVDESKLYTAYNSAYWQLTADITMDGVHEIPSISGSSSLTYFKGVFAGKQKEDGTYPTISNLITSGAYTAASTLNALFVKTTGATFKNFNIENASVTATGAAGIVAANATGCTFENINVSGKVTSTGGATGGIVSDLTASGTGYTAKIINCTSSAEVTCGEGSCAAGGIVGNLSAIKSLYNKVTVEVSGCKNTGAITSAGYAGGIIGQSRYLSLAKISDCRNGGAVSGAKHTGGIVGYGLDGIDIGNSVNTGAVSMSGSSSYAGGIAGYVSLYSSAKDVENSIADCYTSGTVSAAAGKAGGLVGSVSSEGYVIDNSYYLENESGYGVTAYDRGAAITDAYAMSASVMTSGELAVRLGDAYAIPAATSDGYPVLVSEIAEGELHVIKVSSASASSDTTGTTESGTTDGTVETLDTSDTEDTTEEAVETPCMFIKIGSVETASVNAVSGAVVKFEVVSNTEGYSVSALSMTEGTGGTATALTADSDGYYTVPVGDADITLTAELVKNAYTVELTDSAAAEGKVYNVGDVISVNVKVKKTEDTTDTVNFAAFQGELTYDPEVLEYVEATSSDSDTGAYTQVSETTDGTLFVTRASAADTALDTTGVVVATIQFCVKNRVGSDSVKTALGVSAAAGAKGSDPDLTDKSQLAVPVGTEVTVAGSSDLIFIDYAGAPDGYKLAAYRTVKELESDRQLLYNTGVMIHASAFDKLKFTAAESSTDTSSTDTGSGESTSSDDQLMKPDGTVENGTVTYTYVYFVPVATTKADALKNISLKSVTETSDGESVDYSSYDITENSVVNIFDAQRVWDLFSYETFTKATEFVNNPGMYQRLHADVNQDGILNILDAVLIQKSLYSTAE